MYKIAVVGDYDSIYGFATLGLGICPVKDREEIRDRLRRLVELEKYREKTLPAIIRIPGVSGNNGAGIEGVRKTVEQAVGSDILFGGVS